MKLSQIDFRYSHITFEHVEVVVGVFTHDSTGKCLRLKWFALKHMRKMPSMISSFYILIVLIII